MPPEFNPSSAKRDPYTGEFLSVAEWIRRGYGIDVQDVPDWVMHNPEGGDWSETCCE